MENTYIIAMIDSLKKKLEILEEIHQKDEEQYKLICQTPFPVEEFDKNSDEKGVLIYRLNQLDEGFQKMFDNIKPEIENNKEAYKKEIQEMQELITAITEKSTSVQAEEARNKAALEQFFKREHKRIKAGRSQAKAIKSYNQAIINGRGGLVN